MSWSPIAPHACEQDELDAMNATRLGHDAACRRDGDDAWTCALGCPQLLELQLDPRTTFSQTTADVWVEAERDRIGYYPGHEPTCPMRNEPFGRVACACGPRE